VDESVVVDERISEDITLESLAARLDSLGKQMDWLCENLQSLFLFVQSIGANGGGIRGLMSAMKNAPEMKEAMNNVQH
jgi:hypothetical protein